MNRVVLDVLGVGIAMVGLGVLLGACDSPPDGPTVGYGVNPGCSQYATCGTCTPVIGCGWCSDPGGGGLCASDPGVCQGGSRAWTQTAQECPPLGRRTDDAGLLAADAHANDVSAEATTAEAGTDATPADGTAADAIEAEASAEATGESDAVPGDATLADATVTDTGLPDAVTKDRDAEASEAADGAMPDGSGSAGACAPNNGVLCGLSTPYGFTCRSGNVADPSAVVPAPPPLLACAVISVPTPAGTLFYCCAHAP